MKFSQFFIDRPIFAAVLSLLVVIGGALALPRLPISEYPSVIPPTVVVRGVYPGANPKVIAETVASPLEQQLNGVEGLLYMYSQATADGRLTLTVTFALGTDLDNAQVQVQNRVSQALPRLPQDVQRIGVTTEKASPDFLLVAHLVSPDDRYNMLYLSNFAHLQVKDELARIPGVGSVQIFGAGEYSMRVWLDPDKLAARQLTATDVVRAIREQNVQVAAGTLGAPPAPSDTTFQLSVNAQGRLSTEEEFADIVVRATPEGQITKLGDIGRVELGSNMYALRSLLDNQQAVAIGIAQRPGSNALEASAKVRETMERLKQAFPAGIEYRIVYDPTVYVRESINAVVVTLFEAILLVVIVVVVFLQTWRASIIPLVAVPVSLIGTFAVMLAFGFSLNTLSLFGLVLSIGIVVDDAIVVVENVERHIELGLSPIEASRKAMNEVSGPIIAIALVLCAVFVPTAFVSGLTGQFYRQFALTIAISTVISAFNSLTLSPALASRLLRGHGAPRDIVQRGIDRVFGWFFRLFNRFFKRSSTAYAGGVARLLRVSSAALILYVGLVGLTVFGFTRVPQGFVPPQDKDYLVAFAQLPDAATLDRTDTVIRRMSTLALEHPGVANAVAFPGLSVNGFVNASNAGIVFVILKPSQDRQSRELAAASIVQDLNGKFGGIEEAFVAVFPPPPVQGLGSIGGFKLYVEDRASLGFEELYQQVQGTIGAGYADGRLTALFSSFQVSVPQIDAHVDRERAKTYGVALTDVFETLQVYLGSLYVNDFNRFGRTYQVNVQAESRFQAAARTDCRLEDTQRRRRDDASRVARQGRRHLWTRSGDALQRVSGRGDQRWTGAWDQLEPGAAGHRQPPRRALAARHGVRVDGARLPGADSRQHDAPDLSAVRPARVCRARGAVRKLVAAPQRDPDCADDDPLGDRRSVGDWRRQQRLHADQLSRSGRPRLQERNSHRRVRPAARGGGRGSADRNPRCLPRTAAARAHDVGGIHHGCPAARLRHWRRLRDSAGDGRRGLRGDARCHGVRTVSDAGVLHGCRTPRGTCGTPNAGAGGAVGSCRGGGSLRCCE